VLLLISLREVAAFGRLARLDGLRHDADAAIAAGDLAAARGVTDRLVKLYKGREDTRWGRDRLAELRGVAALTSNLRMIRRIAEIYGGRSGLLGSWRLTRAVLSHLVATGAVAVGDDMLEPILGGGLLGKLSRRFGEGLVNGGLTARVGVAAMEVCRPLPFAAEKRPSVRAIIGRALGGLFGKGS